MIGARMSFKPLLLCLVALAIGFVVGLPMGALSLMRSGPRGSASGASGPFGAANGALLPPASSSGRPQPGAASVPDTLGGRLGELFESHAETGFIFSYFDAFDEKAAELLAAQGTDALRALALEWSRGPDVKGEMLSTVFMHWALRDPGSAWQAAMGAQKDRRGDALEGCLRALSASDHLAALKKLETVADEELRKSVKNGFEKSAQRFWKAESLARRLLEMPESDRPKGLLKEVMQSWASRHLRGALDFAEAMPAKEREAILPEFCEALAWFDHDEATRIARSIQDPARSAEAWSGVLRAFGEIAPELAGPMMESLPLEEMDAKLFERLEASQLPLDVIGRIASRLTGDSRDEFLSRVFLNASLFSSSQLQARLDAIELQPEDGAWVEHVMGRMMEISPDAAINWLQGLPESRLRDYALAGAREDLMDRRPAEAMRLAASIQGGEKRLKEMRIGLDQWLRRDRAAAIGWLRSSGGNVLPAAERDRWLSLSGAKP